MGQFPPAGLSLVVMLKPRPWRPLVSSNSILRPIFRVLAICNALTFLDTPGIFFVGDTVATLVFVISEKFHPDYNTNISLACALTFLLAFDHRHVLFILREPGIYGRGRFPQAFQTVTFYNPQPQFRWCKREFEHLLHAATNQRRSLFLTNSKQRTTDFWNGMFSRFCPFISTIRS